MLRLRKFLIENILAVLIFFAYTSFFLPSKVFAVDPVGFWTTSIKTLPNQIGSHTSVSQGAKIIVLGGANIDDYSKVIVSNVNTDGSISSWEDTVGLPDTRYWISSAKKNNKIYILGGAKYEGATYYKGTVFVGTLNSSGVITGWEELTATPLPQTRALGSTAIVGNRIYYAGGFDSSGLHGDIYYADINSDGTLGSWTTSLVSLPDTLYGFSLLSYQNNLLVIGGAGGAGASFKTYKSPINSDGSLNAWQELTPMPAGSGVYRSHVKIIGSTLISVGGGNGFVPVNTIHYTNIKPDITFDTWTQSSSVLPQALQAGAMEYVNGNLYLMGGFNSTGQYLNTVYYAPVNISGDILDVPYFSQNDEPWGPTEYDHASSSGFLEAGLETTIDRWGCLVTSLAMILRYHSMTEFPNGTPIDPGSLNVWLKNNNGYQTGKNKKNEPFSYFVWSSIQRLTKDLFLAGKAPYKLLHKRPGNDENRSAILENDLKNEKLPGILGVNNNSHFVVAKGKTLDSFAVNDPEWNYPDLTSFENNEFSQFDRYVKSNTNYAYLEMSINEEVEILVIDSEGKKTGKQLVNGSIQEFKEIPNAVYSRGKPLSNEGENFGIGFNQFLLPEPANGNYQIILSSVNSEFYTLNLAALESEGDDKSFKFVGMVSPNTNDVYDLNYSQNNQPVLTEVVIFDSLINDIKALRATGDINNLGVYISLLVKAETAKRLSGNVWTKKASVNLLKAIQNELNAQKGKKVSENAYNILSKDIEALLL